MEEVEITPNTVFAGHGYVQQEGRKRCGEQCILYHSYLISESHDFPDAIDSAYEVSIALGLKTTPVPLEKGQDQQKGDLDGDMMMGDGSEKGLDNQMSKLELSAFTVERGSVFEDS